MEEMLSKQIPAVINNGWMAHKKKNRWLTKNRSCSPSKPHLSLSKSKKLVAECKYIFIFSTCVYIIFNIVYDI